MIVVQEAKRPLPLQGKKREEKIITKHDRGLGQTRRKVDKPGQTSSEGQ